MVKMVNIHEAKTTLSELMVRVAGGEEIVIARAGTPVGRIVPERLKLKRRTPGSAKGQLKLRDDFDAALPESLIADFEN